MEQKSLTIKKALKLFAGAEVLNRILKLGTEALKPTFKEKYLTLYGQDIKGFKSQNQSIASEDLIAFQREYLNEMSDNIIEHDGNIDHYYGDFILAYWNTNNDSHVYSACKCSIRSIDIARKLSRDWQTKGLSDLKLKIGITSGAVLMGNFGSKYRLNYTLAGDKVNILYRLVSANEHFGTNILISSTSTQYLKNEFNIQNIEDIMIKGKNHSDTLYTIKTTTNNRF